MKRIQFSHNVRKSLTILFMAVLLPCSLKGAKETEAKPNVVVIMTDDQGIGEFGFMGNPYIKTPVLDEMASQSLNLTHFYVSPVCAPTRASLMTGKFYEHTGVYDTYNGGAIMSAEEVTIAEVLKENGYETGIFGKWHLGDNYPYRPIDQGFDEAVVHRTGGIGQPGDIFNFHAGDRSYFDPVLFENGEPVRTKGYCSDVFTDETINFIRNNRERDSSTPFFAYLSFNAPHLPLQLPEKYYNMYKDIEFDADEFGVFDEAVEQMSPAEIESARKVYGMVTHIDDNIGKLIQVLKDEGVYENTVIIFLSDNGPQYDRYKMGLRGRKSSVYEGGVRVPCLIHYPRRFKEKEEIDATTAHIDLLPSVLDLCGIEKPAYEIDGLSVLTANGENETAFENRTLFLEWGRGYPVKYRKFAALKGKFKLVGNTDMHAGVKDFELFNLDEDPREQDNIVNENLPVAKELKKEMDAWYAEISSDENNRRNFPAYVGTPHENPVLLNRNDAKGTPAVWSGENVLNYWEVKALEDGVYDIRLHFIKPVKKPGKIVLKMYPYHFVRECQGNISEWTFKNVEIEKGEYKLEPYYQTRNQTYIFPFYVSVERIDD